MKKFYFFLLALICSVAGMAQTQVKVTSKTGPVAAPESGKLYAILCNSQQSYTTWMYDDGTTSAPVAKKDLALDVDELVQTQYFWKITPGAGDGVYSFQNYATNRYISVDGTGDGGTASMKDAETTAIISTEDGNEYIAIKNMTADAWIDMGWNGTSNCTWSGGISGSRRMQIYEVTVEEVSSREEIVADLKTTFNDYNTNYPAGDFTPGTGYGEYGAAELEAYTAALEYAGNVIDAEGGDLSDDEIKAAKQNIIDTYNALAKSRISYAMEVKPGYYVIKNALTFTTTETTPEYEDPESGEIIGGETITKYWPKAIYENRGYACWKTFEEKADFLFKVEATSTPKAYKVTNVLNGLTFDPVKTSTNETMSATDSLICFDWRYDNVKVITDTVDVEKSKLVTTVNIRLAAQAERDYYYIHAGGHASGAGVSGNIVGWSTGSAEAVGATDWYLEEIDEATAQKWIEAASPVLKIRAVIDSIAAIETAYPAQKTIAIDKYAKIDYTSPAITSGTQFSSPYTTIDEQSATEEQIFENLINEEGTTYWHSAWESGSVAADVHYLQVADVDLTTAAVKITRRSAANDSPTKLRVKGYTTNDASLTFEDGKDLGVITFPFGSTGEVVESPDVFDATGCPVLRFYWEESNGTSYQRGYWHVKKFQIYPAEVGYSAETTQATARAAEMKAVEDALAAWDAKGYTETSVTDPNDADFVAAYTAVYNAYAAWQAVYTDPAAMRTAAEKATSFAASMEKGTNPGQWLDTDASVINDAIAAEQAYNNTGKYTAEEVAAQAQAINDALAAVKGKAIKVNPLKWYTIRFATEEEYTLWGWDKTGAVSETYQDLYGMKIAPANANKEEDGTYSYEQVTGEDVRKGAQIRFCSDDPDECQFRFVDAGNGKYYLQHVSGWYVGTNGTLSNHPALVSTEAIGCSKSLIKVQDLQGKDITTGTSPSYLHAQVAGHSLVAWSADAIDSRSALYIEEVAAPSEVATTQYETILPGTQRFYTSPTTITNVEGAQLYTFAGYENNNGVVKVAFDKTNAAEAGKAVLMVVDGTYPEEPTEEDNANAISYTLGDTFAAVPDSTQALKGTYTYQWVAAADTASTVTIYKNTICMAAGKDNTDCSRDISAYTGAIYLENCEIDTTGKDLVIEVAGVDPTAIKEVVAKAINTVGKIYTVDGKYMGTGNIATASKYGKGIYVINGVKVSIK